MRELSSILTKDESKGGYEHSEEGVWRRVAPGLLHDALRRLFEDRHLYQSVEVQEGDTAKQIIAYWRELLPNRGSGAANWSTGGSTSTWTTHSSDPSEPESQESKVIRAQAELGKVLAAPWRAEVLRNPTGTHLSGHASFGSGFARGSEDAEAIVFPAPRAVRTHCSFCDSRTAFNPVSSFGFEAAADWTGTGRSEDEQHFGYSYECQHCAGPKRGRVVFLMVRRGGKITLCGREPLESVSVESYIPKPLRKFISGALIAHRAGQTLSGLFQLRTFIEQFWRSLPSVEKVRLDALQAGKRLAGDELANAYAKLLPDDFKQRFPSLGKIYENLSAAMHDAKEGDEAATIFNAALDGINEHFDAHRLYKLTL